MIFVVYFGENICYTGYKDKKMTFAYCEKGNQETRVKYVTLG